MNVEFFFHGVASAFQEWGSTKDSMDRFYANIDKIQENTRFTIELGKNGDTYCVYYTYLKAKNVVDFTGRSGSYFAITLRFDEEYCQDITSLYNMCEMVYYQNVCKKLLKIEGETTKYLVQNFDSSSAFLTDLCKSMASAISDFRHSAIQKDLLGTANGAPSKFFNLKEVGSTLFWDTLKSSQKVFVSTDYPTKDAKIAQLNNILEPERQKNDVLEKQITELKKQQSQKEAEIVSYKQEIAKLKAESSNAKVKKNNVEHKSRKLNEDEDREKDKERHNFSFKNFLKKIRLADIISILNLCICSIILLIQTSVINIKKNLDVETQAKNTSSDVAIIVNANSNTTIESNIEDSTATNITDSITTNK